ncbi:hypothetical protein [Arenimonas sp. MALMAid1274]|uniref:hypothetical protein n=1 Tax=Arenimonas sp. MALMAid1274 TaxID=3411630 RepID=UPI003B9DD13C
MDGDGWGEANTGQTGSDGASESDGHKAGERSFDDGVADTPADKAAPASKPREPGKKESTKPAK